MTILLLLFSWLAFSKDTPQPKEIEIQNFQYQGTGCKPGSVASMLSPDAKSFTLLFDNFIVENASETPATKNCVVQFHLKVPQGWALALYTLDYRGYVDIRERAVGRMRSAYNFLPDMDKEKEVGHYREVGPQQKDYFYRQMTPANSADYSTCKGKHRHLRINTAITVKGTGVMTVDSQNGEIVQKYGIAWKRCR